MYKIGRLSVANLEGTIFQVTLQFSFCKICFEAWSKAGIVLTPARS